MNQYKQDKDFFWYVFWIVAIVIAILAYTLLQSCSKKEKHSFSTVEDARLQAKENAAFLAKSYRADNNLTDYDIYVRGDSTIRSDCPNGDGWASLDLKKGKKVIKLKCSTVSVGLGCMTSEDFKSKTYATEDGKCNPEVPHPLPKLVM